MDSKEKNKIKSFCEGAIAHMNEVIKEVTNPTPTFKVWDWVEHSEVGSQRCLSIVYYPLEFRQTQQKVRGRPTPPYGGGL